MLRVVGVLGALAALAVVGATGSAQAQAMSNRVAFTDARGENTGGIDISRVVVAAPSDGTIVFRIEIPTNARFGEDMSVRVWIDSDANPATGRDGVDYFLLADEDVAALYRCANPPTCDVFDQPGSISFRFSYRSGATFVVNRRELGNTKRIRFFAAAYEGISRKPGDTDLSKARYDFAPREGQWWTFDTRALIARSFSASPKAPRAGKPFAVRLEATRTATGAVVTQGRVACTLRVGRRLVTPRSKGFVGRHAVCTFDVPAGARGLRYRAAITVRVGTYAVARSLSGRVG